VDVQFAPVALGERREGGFFTRNRGGARVSAINGSLWIRDGDTESRLNKDVL